MKNNYIIMAILPFLFQNTVYSADLNTMIKTELENARKMARIHVKLELDPVLQALVAHGKKSDANSIQAVNAIKDIKNALLQYRSEQYTSNWYDITAYFKSNPEIVSQEIDPALAKVNNALNMLQKNASIYNYKNALGLIGVVAAIGAAAYGINKYRAKAAVNKAAVNKAGEKDWDFYENPKKLPIGSFDASSIDPYRVANTQAIPSTSLEQATEDFTARADRNEEYIAQTAAASAGQTPRASNHGHRNPHAATAFNRSRKIHHAADSAPNQ